MSVVRDVHWSAYTVDIKVDDVYVP